ncbi:MAG: RecBCD enzyme subunit RecD [bacterium]|nr:RecBCD enzyme subunit RecD [bacterium]
MNIDRFREAIRAVQRASLKPFKMVVAGVETETSARIIRAFPKRKGSEDNLPDPRYLEGDCVIKDTANKKILFSGQLLRVNETDQCLVIKKASGRDLVVGDELLVFPPDYLKGLLEWSKGLRGLPVLYESVGRSTWPDSSAGHVVIPALTDHVGTLRERQRQASSVARKQIGLIWGPPGTGKTFTVGAIALAHILDGRKVLAVGPTNRSVDLLVLETDNAARSSGHTLPEGTILRLGYPQHPEFDFPGRRHLLRFQMCLDEIACKIDQKKAERADFPGAADQDLPFESDAAATKVQFHQLGIERNSLLEHLLPEARLAATTLASLLARNTLWDEEWDLVILDEASLVALPMIAFLLGLQSKQWLFVGDPMQLRPFCSVPKFAPHQVKADIRLLFERTVFDLVGIENESANNRVHRLFDMGIMVRLNEQSRMNESLCDFIAQSFYDGDLNVVGNPPLPCWPPPWPVKPRVVVNKSSAQPPAWITPPSRPFTIQGSKGDLRAARITAGIVHGIRPLLGHDERILVISPFRMQSYYLRHFLSGTPSVEVSTVHRCQGSEALVVVLDPVDSMEGFLTGSRDASRIWNVAISRAKAQVFIVDRPSAIQSNHHIRRFAIGADEWVPEWDGIGVEGLLERGQSAL